MNPIALSGDALKAVRAYQSACLSADITSEADGLRVGALALKMVEQLIDATVLDAADVLPLLRHGYEETVEHGKLWGELSDDWRRLFEASGDWLPPDPETLHPVAEFKEIVVGACETLRTTMEELDRRKAERQNDE